MPSESTAFVCEWCGTSFSRPSWEARRSERRNRPIRFCSMSCRALNSNPPKLKTVLCGGCGTEFEMSKGLENAKVKRGIYRYFCSMACRRSRVIVPCVTCGVPVSRVPAVLATTKYSFCSMACQRAGAIHWDSGKPVFRRRYRPDIGLSLRSTWEANVCRVLSALGLSYEYEPRTFRMDGVCYTPDLFVDGRYWIEVKGQMTEQGQQKIDLFRFHFPDETLVLVNAPVYLQMASEWSGRLPYWE